MTNREKYTQLCTHGDFPLHARAWWLEQSAHTNSWDVLLLEDKEGRIEAALPYVLSSRLGFRMMLMPRHTQYNYMYVAPTASPDIYCRMADTLAAKCREEHIGYVCMQGFYPQAFLEALDRHQYCIKERVTYRIENIPGEEALLDSFSSNKRRQYKKASMLRLVDLSVADFYAFEQSCWSAQGNTIDYPLEWAQSVLGEAVKRGQGRLIAAQDTDGALLASFFMAWDNRYAYFLLPAYYPRTKQQGGMAWLTTQAMRIARSKGLGFDFEGSMIPSIASSYLQFGATPTTYHSIEKYYNPIFRIVIWLHQHI